MIDLRKGIDTFPNQSYIEKKYEPAYQSAIKEYYVFRRL